MYSSRSGLVLGFHGCDIAVAKAIVENKDPMRESQNIYDWLGHGVYFWEYSNQRALEFAEYLMNNPSKCNSKIKTPAVIGAVIDLGLCFDLLDYGSLQILKSSYIAFKEIWESSGEKLPTNRVVGDSGDLLLRELDCAVFETFHHFRKQNNDFAYDSVRGVFWEGGPLYPGAGFREKDHIQICVRNPNCIKGFFYPRELNSKFNKV